MQRGILFTLYYSGTRFCLRKTEVAINQSINQSVSPYFLVYILQLDWPVDTSASLDGPV